MIETRNMVCIVCPVGCRLQVTRDGDNIQVTGNTCKRGEKYARDEFTDPKRTVTSSIQIKGGVLKRVSVRTSTTVSKALIPQVLAELRTLCVNAPVHVGDVAAKNIAGSGADVIITRETPEKE